MSLGAPVHDVTRMAVGGGMRAISDFLYGIGPNRASQEHEPINASVSTLLGVF